MKSTPLFLAFALGLGGCQSVFQAKGEEAQQIVDRHAIGVAAGDFFERYGPPRSRDEALDGTRTFDWEGGLVRIAPGEYGIEDKICRLRITTDRSGRIVGAPIVRDAQGVRRASRCVELFDT